MIFALNLNSKIEKLKFYSSIIAGAIISLLACIVIFGWLINSNTLVRVLPQYPAMVFNTALTFLLVGLGLIGLNLKTPWVTRILAALAFFLTFLICMQYIFNVNLHVDELFKTYNLPQKMLYPGRTSLNTALTLCIGSATLFALSFPLNSIQIGVFFVLSVVAIAIPLSTLFSFIMGLESIPGSTVFSKMAFHTSIGALLFLAVLILNLTLDSLDSSIRIVIIPLGIFLSACTLVLIIWNMFYARDFLRARKEAEREASNVKEIIQDYLKEDILALKRLQNRVELLGGYSNELWLIEKKNYMDDFLAIENMQIINTGSVPISIEQKGGNNSREENSNVGKSYQKGGGGLNYIYNESQDLIQVYFRAKPDASTDQRIVIDINMNALFKKAIERVNFSTYKVIFLKNNHMIYLGKLNDSPTVGSPIERIIDGGFIAFQLKVYVTKKSIKQEQNALDRLFFIIITFISLLAAGVAYFAIKMNMKGQLLGESNQKLLVAKEKADLATVAKSSFLASMSHEIRTPLNSVIGTLQLLNETEIDEVQKKYIARMTFSSKLLLSLINDILDFSKIEANSLKFERVSFDISDVAKNICESFYVKTLEKNVPILLHMPAEPMPQLMGDPHRLEQILVNLINNAFKFTDSGKIQLKISFLSKTEANVQLRIEIVDSGIGISPQNQEKLFRKFSQVEVSDARKFGGVGLGLSICKGIVEKLNGQIGVTSEEGKGATFWFELLYDVDPQGAKENPYSLENNRILLIDSDQGEKEILTQYLTAWKAQIDSEYKEEGSYDLIIISQDQGELIQKLQAKGFPILYIEQQSLNQVGDDILSKPITPKSLWSAIQKKRGK